MHAKQNNLYTKRSSSSEEDEESTSEEEEITYSKEEEEEILQSIDLLNKQPLHKIARSIKQESQNIYYRLKSIAHDYHSFIEPLVDRCQENCNIVTFANLRCGEWYSPHFHNTCYFKSGDGHAYHYNFALSRLNLQLLQSLQQPQHGYQQQHCSSSSSLRQRKGQRLPDALVIVDSTRKGKEFPDSFNRTVPIWCYVMNHVCLKQPGLEELELPKWIQTNQEKELILNKIHQDWIPMLSKQEEQFSKMFQPFENISKPLKCIWISPNSLCVHVQPHYRVEIKELMSRMNQSHQSTKTRHQQQPTGAPNEELIELLAELLEMKEKLPFVPVVLVSASNSAIPEKYFGNWNYVQGAGDDHQSWSHGLTAQLFWKSLYKKHFDPSNRQLQQPPTEHNFKTFLAKFTQEVKTCVQLAKRQQSAVSTTTNNTKQQRTAAVAPSSEDEDEDDYFQSSSDDDDESDSESETTEKRLSSAPLHQVVVESTAIHQTQQVYICAHRNDLKRIQAIKTQFQAGILITTPSFPQLQSNLKEKSKREYAQETSYSTTESSTSSTTTTDCRFSKEDPFLVVSVVDAKKDKKSLERNLEDMMEFLKMHLERQQKEESSYKIVISDCTGDAESVVVAVAMLCKWFDENSNLRQLSHHLISQPPSSPAEGDATTTTTLHHSSPSSYLDKQFIRSKLAYLQSFIPSAAPSKHLMNQLNRFFFS